MLLSEVLNAANHSVLCWLATVNGNGQPNVSPKEMFTLFDNEHLVIANIASPTSVRNVVINPQVCVSFVDVFVQKGFKIFGIARNVRQQDEHFSHWLAPLATMARPRFPTHSVIVVRIGTIEPILAPSYRLYANETTEQAQVEAAMHSYGVRPACNDG